MLPPMMPPPRKTALPTVRPGGTIPYRSAGLTITGPVVGFDATSSTVSIFGVAADQAAKRSCFLLRQRGVGRRNVNDSMSVDQNPTRATYHDGCAATRWRAIAKAAYGDGNKYPVIFEANKPMLSHLQGFLSGQKLRIPPPSPPATAAPSAWRGGDVLCVEMTTEPLTAANHDSSPVPVRADDHPSEGCRHWL